jgi:polyisoprenyl-teichoic acid--peptidoglycan teichoic acid transferase
MVVKKLDFLNKIRTLKRPTTGQFIWLGMGLVVAVGLFFFLRGFVACWSLTALPGSRPSSCVGKTTGLGTNPEGTPVAGATAVPTGNAPQVELPPPWDGASRVTILVIGLDYRDWETGQGAPRSDTMMLLTIDPVAKTAGMLSIPRDMWVNIPGFGYSKINNAYAYGAGFSLPGGGPGLAVKTVENFLGVPIQYYAQVSFNTFEQMIDTIGGIDVNIPYVIIVDPLGPHNTTTLHPGLNHLSGPLALAYARARDVSQGVTGGDVERAQHQQQVILAIRDKVLAPGNFLKLMAEAPTLYSELSGGVDTNLTFNDLRQLAVLAKDIPLDKIQNNVIDYTMMQDGTTILDGLPSAILRPYPDKIRELVDKIFGSGTMQPMATGTVEEKMKAEAARVVVINGTGVSGMAALTSDYLTAQGMNVIGKGNTSDYPDNKYYSPFPDRTIIIVHAGKPYAMQYLMALMKFNSTSQIEVDFDPNAPEDIVVALGTDWGGPP